MELRPATPADTPFLFECLKELRGGVEYPLERFEAYLRAHDLLSHADCRLLVGVDGATRIGMLTCNRFAVPRYLGFGYEIEEVVVHPTFQGKGYGGALIATFLEWAERDPDVRKVLVKTDDAERAGRVYARSFEVVRTVVYARAVHRI